MSFPTPESTPNDPVDAREQQVLDEMAGMEDSSPLTVEVREQGAARVIRLYGELDVATAPVFDARLASVLESHAGPVVVDLAPLSFLDSKGLACFLRAGSRAPDRIAIASPKERITRLFQATGLAERLRVRPTVGDALATLQP